MSSLIVLLVIIFLVGLGIYLYRRHTKNIAMPNVAMITGGVKTGKSFVTVALAVKMYRKQLIRYYLTGWFYKLIKKPKEKPMLYSNMALRYVRFNRLTLDVIFRTVRIPYGSVLLLDELSLFADSLMIRSETLNRKLTDFVKLFGHETKGGFMYVNSQNVSDTHFAFKRAIGSYTWINKKVRYPFFTAVYCHDMVYSDTTGVVNNVNLESADEGVKPMILRNKYFKYYDCYCYSILTDKLPVYVDYDTPVLKKKDSLKTTQVLSLRDVYDMYIKLDNKNKNTRGFNA